jgi:hypothetical protein
VLHGEDQLDTRRIADNEARFREVNEAIWRGSWPGEDDGAASFRCECAARECNLLVSLTPREYERVRANSRHFLVLPGHEAPRGETVVERHPHYVIVEKLGEVGRLLEASDPRS